MTGGTGLAGRFTFDASVLEAIQAAVVVTDLEGVIIAANSRAAHFYGRAHDELIGCDSMVLRAGPIPEDVIAEVADAVMAGRTWEGEFTVVGPDGKPFGVHIIDAPAFDDEGHLIGIVGIGFDVTEYRLGRDDLGRVLAGSRVLRGLVDSLAADGSAERIEHLIADAACRVTGAATAVYYSLVSGADGHLVAEAVIGEAAGSAPGAVLEVGRLGLTGVFVRTEPLVIDDLAGEAWRTSSLAVLGCDGSEPSGSVVLVPVHSRTGAGIGLMALGHPEPGFFSETDVSAVTSVCGQGAVALDLATMFRAATAELEDRRRSEDAQRFLAAASETLASAFDAPRMYEEVARVCVPFLADYCTIDLAVPGGRTRRVATVHADPAVADIVAELDARHRALPTGSAMAVAVAHGGGGGVLADLSDDFLRRNTSDERHLELVRSLGFTSGMCVPLRARGRVLGALTLVSAGSGRVFGAEDLAIAEDYARRAALALDNARLYAERDHTARALQAGLLPTTLPRIRGASLAARYLAAGEQSEVGGDFYDAFLTDDGAAWVLIGDVSGKGPEAAAVVGLARHTLRALGRRERLPRRLLADLHEALLLEDRGEYCTVCCGRLVREPDGGAVLTIAAAGHPPPVLRRAGGRIERTSCSGTLVGMPIGIRFDEQVIRLGPGDAVVFHTDGVTEERDATGEEFGDVRLARAIRTAGSGAGAIADNVVETVRGYGTGEPRDDVAVLVVEIEEDA